MPNRVRCQALDINGRRCRAKSAGRFGRFYYHGDEETHPEPEPGWIVAYFCKIHGKGVTPIQPKEAR